MDRRGLAPLILALFVVFASVLGSAGPTSAGGEPPPVTQPDAEPSTDRAGGSSDEPAAPPPTAPATDRPVPTVSDFYPAENNLSDCIGLVERPGCGSDARGGWGQTAVFAALVAGLGLIIWRVSVGIRRNRAAMSQTASTDDGAGGADGGAGNADGGAGSADGGDGGADRADGAANPEDSRT